MFFYATTRWNCLGILGLLSFSANAEILPALTDLQVRKIRCRLSIIITHTDICSSQINNSVKEYICYSIPNSLWGKTIKSLFFLKTLRKWDSVLSVISTVAFSLVVVISSSYCVLNSSTFTIVIVCVNAINLSFHAD